MVDLKQVFTKPVKIHWECVWTQYGDLQLSGEKLQLFVKHLLDNGVEVKGYWKNLTEEYRKIDPRIGAGTRV